MHLIISCGSKTVWNALFVYLHHLCLIFLVGTDIVFSVAEFDEITGRYQYHDPTEGVEPDEEERVVYPPAQEEHEICPPVQEETITPWGEGSSSGWGSGPSSSAWENPRMSVYAPDFPYDPWTHQYYPGARGSSGPQ